MWDLNTITSDGDSVTKLINLIDLSDKFNGQPRPSAIYSLANSTMIEYNLVIFHLTNID